MRVYVASPYTNAAGVRDVHVRLVERGITPTSTWAEAVTGRERLSAFFSAEFRALAEANDRALRVSDAVLVWSLPDGGGEMYAEARFALVLEIPVYWVGRPILSTYRRGVRLFDDIDAAITALSEKARAKAVAS